MYNPIDIQRIDRQIEDLQRIKANYQQMSQPAVPINNIINTQNQPIFEAKFTNENPSDIYVQNKTAFIDLKNGILTIKERVSYKQMKLDKVYWKFFCRC